VAKDPRIFRVTSVPNVLQYIGERPEMTSHNGTLWKAKTTKEIIYETLKDHENSRFNNQLDRACLYGECGTADARVPADANQARFTADANQACFTSDVTASRPSVLSARFERAAPECTQRSL
jgi:hypothetical protein